jgi:hypothetical protein
VAGDESWCVQFDPEKKRQMARKEFFPAEERLKKPHVQTMLVVFLMLPELSTVSLFLKAPQSTFTII